MRVSNNVNYNVKFNQFNGNKQRVLSFGQNYKRDEYLPANNHDEQPKKGPIRRFIDYIADRFSDPYYYDSYGQHSYDITRMQQETIDWDKKHKNDNFNSAHTNSPKNPDTNKSVAAVSTQQSLTTYSPRTTIRTAKTVQPQQKSITESTKKIIRTNPIPIPSFSFNYQKLIADISDINEVDVNWVEQNPQSVNNIFNATSKGSGISQQAIEECYLSPESKANAINQLLSKKEEFLKEAETQYSFEKQQYISKVLEFINSTEDQDSIIQALDKIQQYGTADDLERINANVWMTSEEPLVVKLSQTVGKIGRKDIDDYQLIDYVVPSSKLSCDGYTEVFKAVSKLSSSYSDKEYDKLIYHLNNIPHDKNGNFTEALTEMLISVGKKEYISQLDDYLRNFSYVNDFMNKGQKTPQAVLDVIDKVKVGLQAKI